MSVSDAEPVMLEQISRISQQLATTCIVPVCAAGHCSAASASGRPTAGQSHLGAEQSVSTKGVNISLDISPEISFVGEQTILSR